MHLVHILFCHLCNGDSNEQQEDVNTLSHRSCLLRDLGLRPWSCLVGILQGALAVC